MNISIKTKLLAVAMAAAMLPLAASAQTYAETVWNQLQAGYEIVSDDGYLPRNYIVGKLADDKTDSWTLTFEGGKDYLIQGVCDGDCTDIDLKLTDSNDRVLSHDNEDDDNPVVSVSPSGNQTLTIEVGMYACSSEPCYFGVGIYYK